MATEREQERCGVCNSETEVYARIVGYLRPVKQWNEGKRAEFDLRKPFALTGDSAYVLEQEQFPSISRTRGALSPAQDRLTAMFNDYRRAAKDSLIDFPGKVSWRVFCLGM